jgi:antirestriction protein ArdC
MATKTKTKVKADPYQAVTDRIVEALEAGTVPWRKPWRSVNGIGPTSLSTGREYQGINVLMLSIAAFAGGYSSIYWGTYRQIAELGGQVRKGEKSTEAVLLKKVVKKDGDEDKSFFMLRTFAIFNADQADWPEGSKLPSEPARPEHKWTPVELAERIHLGMPMRPEVKHGGNRAYYSPLLDYVGMPELGQFDGAEPYYATLFHELVHATGHKSRIGRDGIEAFQTWGDENYSREELIAEIGAAILCTEAGIEPRIDQSAAYIGGWLKVLKDDKKAIVAAASGAGKAVDFILDRPKREGRA